jgi:hypothetical protein
MRVSRWAIAIKDKHGKLWFLTEDAKWSEQKQEAQWSGRKDVMHNTLSNHHAVLSGACLVDLNRMQGLLQCRYCKKLYQPREISDGICVGCDSI